MNLLDQTIKILRDNGKTPEDVQYINCNEKSCSWKKFSTLANFYYHKGYGKQEVNESLKVVGKDWWLERYEYDGSEWWEFKTLPIRYNKSKLVTRQDLIDDRDIEKDDDDDEE